MHRRGDSQQRRWSAWGWGLSVLLTALSFSACIEDVPIPECLMNGTCQGGAGEGGDGPPSSAGKTGGGGKGNSVDGGAGQATAGGAGAQAAMAGQAGEGPEPCACEILPQVLTAACAGKPYQTTLTVSGGRAPYSWQLDPQPKGWSVGPSTQYPNSAVLRVDAAPAEGTELTLVVTDARNARRTFTLPLEVRSSCWFAYTSLEGSGPELRLVDWLANEPAPVPLAHAVGAYDFQFSPDGAFLAYRYGADQDYPMGRHLSVVDLKTLKEHDLGFDEDQVASYSWSSSSGLLAAAFEKDGKTYLGGVHTPVPGSDASPPVLASTSASVESELYWVGNDYVAFHAASGKRRAAFYSELGSAGFASPQELIHSFAVGVAVQPTETGFFLITPNETFYSDLTDGVWSGIEHPEIALVAPSGRYTAHLDDDGLPQLFPAETADFANVVESADDTHPCTKLLAWATDQERVACVMDVSNGPTGTHGEIRIFDLEANPVRLDSTTLEGFCSDDVSDTSTGSCLFKREGYSFGSAQAEGSARAFSRSGRYFAFARALPGIVYIYLADLDAAPARVAQPVILSVDGIAFSPLAFAFSTDERFLLVRRGPKLSVIELATGAATSLASNLTDAESCSEEFLAAPERYCGNTNQLAAPEWARDSRSLAFRTTDGLTIIDLSPFPKKSVKVLPAVACATQCSGQFSFQP